MLRFWSSLPLALLLATTALFAQDVPTISKASDVAVFGGFVSANTAYTDGSVYPNDPGKGAFLGMDFTRYFHLPVAPSLEGRANVVQGPYINEHSYLGGLQVQGNIFDRFHPYGDFLAGYGSILYNRPAVPGYTHDNSLVYSYGGGVNLDVTRNFQAMLDFQAQSWKIGNNATEKFSPIMFSIGFRYVIPFGPHLSARYNHN